MHLRMWTKPNERMGLIFLHRMNWVRNLAVKWICLRRGRGRSHITLFVSKRNSCRGALPSNLLVFGQISLFLRVNTAFLSLKIQCQGCFSRLIIIFEVAFNDFRGQFFFQFRGYFSTNVWDKYHYLTSGNVQCNKNSTLLF